jgi:Tol biopolymer transport system component/DNA-binding winged helix-turn-helix (wHTH) protein
MAVSKQKQSFYEFGAFRIDAANRLLLKDGEPVALQPKMFDTLLVLVENRGQVIEKDELMSRIWPDTIVEESNLTQNIYILRKVLGTRVIETMPKRGYRFSADVREIRSEETNFILERQTVSHILVEEEAEIEDSFTASLPEALSDKPGILQARPTAPGIVASITGHKKMAALAGVTAIMVLTGIALFMFGSQANRKSAEAFQKISISRLTDIGRVVFPTISPDGKYVAYVSLDDEDHKSIWVKHLATGSATQIVPAVAKAGYESLVFSRDGNYIYFNRNEKGPPNSLYQVPVLGGAARRLIENVWGAVTFSPDSKRLAFIRADWQKGEHALIVANTDGTDEQALATRRSPDYFNVFGIGPAWSPDGKTIACSAGNQTDDQQYLVEVRVEDGSERFISAERWDSVGQLVWVADGAGLVFFARKQPSLPEQIWYLSYPQGELRRITNDLSAYQWLAVTADSSMLVAQRGEVISNIWIAPSDGATLHSNGAGFAVDTSRAKQITLGVGKNDGFYGICWTPDDKIIYSSDANGNRDLWIADSDGTNQRQLTMNVGSFNAYPSVSADERYIVFSSNRAGAQNIWRMDADGRNPRQLTRGRGEYHSSLSPDGQWVVYGSGESDWHLWKVPIDGGEPVQLTQYQAGKPVVSPDGKLIAYGYFDDQMSLPWRIGIIPFEGGPMRKSFPAHFRSHVRWTLDGQSLMYISETHVSDIWSQPLEGSPPKRLTNFKEMRIYYFDWSRDGSWLACARGTANSDAVMIHDLK